MIARIRGYRGPEYVALHRDPRARDDVWVPIRGDRGRSGEVSAMAAARMCVEDVRKQLAPAVRAAEKLFKLCDRRPPPAAMTAKQARQLHGLARTVTESLSSAWANLDRLLDAPSAEDTVDIDGELDWTPIR